MPYECKLTWTGNLGCSKMFDLQNRKVLSFLPYLSKQPKIHKEIQMLCFIKKLFIQDTSFGIWVISHLLQKFEKTLMRISLCFELKVEALYDLFKFLCRCSQSLWQNLLSSKLIKARWLLVDCSKFPIKFQNQNRSSITWLQVKVQFQWLCYRAF